MAYLDHHAHKNLAGITGVALVHVALAFGLVAGLTVKYTIEEGEPPFTGETVTEFPIPEPTELPPPPDTTTQTPPDNPNLPAPAPIPTIDIGTAPAPHFPTDLIPSTGPVVVELPPVGPTVQPPSPPAFTPTNPVPGNGPTGWVTTNDYPLRALSRGWEGTLTYAVAVDARGRVEDCRIVSSSGHQILDDTACRMITRRARFEPAINANGSTVAGTYRGTVAWVMPRD